MATVHVKIHAQSRDIELYDLFPDNQSVTVEELSDTEIRQAVSEHLDVALREFDSYEVQRHANGNATIHPQAEFGN